MIEQHAALMRGIWSSPEPWVLSWLDYTGQNIDERGTILVVDHDRTVRSFLATLLPQYGYHVVTAATAEEAEDARQLIAPDSIDLVFTDIHLHDMSQTWEGYALYHCWTTLEPNLPFILTSNVPCAQALFILRRPTVRFLVKPFTTKALLDTVASLINV